MAYILVDESKSSSSYYLIDSFAVLINNKICGIKALVNKNFKYISNSVKIKKNISLCPVKKTINAAKYVLLTNENFEIKCVEKPPLIRSHPRDCRKTPLQSTQTP